MAAEHAGRPQVPAAGKPTQQISPPQFSPPIDRATDPDIVESAMAATDRVIADAMAMSPLDASLSTWSPSLPERGVRTPPRQS